MRTLRNILILIVLAMLAALPANAATWYVHPAGAGDATTIQAGVDLAAGGDVVLLAPGTYSGTGNVNVTVSGKAITITSESGAYFTVVDCQGSGRGFYFTNAGGSILEGVTVKNGNATQGGAVHIDDCAVTVRNSVFSGNTATSAGGAIYARKNSPVIHNNTIEGNSAPTGGGIALKGPITGQVYQNIISGSVSGAGVACVTGPFNTVVSCNNLWGNAGGNSVCAQDGGNNFSADPLFCGITGSGNYFLQQTSPCAPAFSPCTQPIGALSVQCEVTGTESVSWGRIKEMYR